MAESSGIRRFFNRHWEKLVLWTILIGLFYLLRPFFLLIFLTFLITYITRGVVARMVRHFGISHRSTTLLVFLLLVSLVVVTGAWIGPRLLRESNQIVGDLVGEGEQQTREKTARFVESVVIRLAGAEQGQALIGSERYAALRETLRASTAEALNNALPGLVARLLHLVKLGWEALVALFLSIIFSFILLMDWQRIADHMRDLERSRIRTFYVGVAPHLCAFADVLGKALRAQALIASANTVLTGVGLWYYDVPNLALLSSVVFLCGFIPIVGTFISSLPILLFTVQAGGVALAMKMVALLVVVHALEAYVLNPRITAGVLRAHPLLVLGLLLIGERFFGLWGLVVGVPIGYYVISVLTMKDEGSAPEGAGTVSPGELT